MIDIAMPSLGLASYLLVWSHSATSLQDRLVSTFAERHEEPGRCELL